MKKLLAVIDYQHDFVDGPLGFPRAAAIEQAIAEEIERCRAEGWDILFSMDTHFDNQQSERSGWELYGCIAGLKEGEDITISKHTLGSADFAQLLLTRQYDSIHFAGVTTHLCVMANAVIARVFLPEAEISIDTRCVADADERLERAALEIMESMKMKVYY